MCAFFSLFKKKLAKIIANAKKQVNDEDPMNPCKMDIRSRIVLGSSL